MTEGMELDAILDKALASSKGISLTLASPAEVKQWQMRLLARRQRDRREQGQLVDLKIGASRWDSLIFKRQKNELVIERLDYSKITIKEL